MVDNIWFEVLERLRQTLVANVVLTQTNGGIEVVPIAGRQLVDDRDVMTRGAEAIGDVRADEPGAACDQNFHYESLVGSRRPYLVEVDDAVELELLASQFSSCHQEV